MHPYQDLFQTASWYYSTEVLDIAYEQYMVQDPPALRLTSQLTTVHEMMRWNISMKYEDFLNEPINIITLGIFLKIT